MNQKSIDVSPVQGRLLRVPHRALSADIAGWDFTSDFIRDLSTHCRIQTIVRITQKKTRFSAVKRPSTIAAKNHGCLNHGRVGTLTATTFSRPATNPFKCAASGGCVRNERVTITITPPQRPHTADQRFAAMGETK